VKKAISLLVYFPNYQVYISWSYPLADPLVYEAPEVPNVRDNYVIRKRTSLESRDQADHVEE
jgi:hypothetical protein